MRVATINIPRALNNGQPCPAVLSTAIHEIITAFNGCTVVDTGVGYWKDDKGVLVQDQVNIVTIAMEPTDDNDAILKGIAERVAVAADQQSVYVIYADGVVDFITQPKRN